MRRSEPHETDRLVWGGVLTMSMWTLPRLRLVPSGAQIGGGGLGVPPAATAGGWAWRPPRALSLVAVSAALAVALAALLLATIGADPGTAGLLLSLTVGAGIIAATAWRPSIGCGFMVIGVPLTAGLGRGTVIPFLRLSEALTILVAAGLLLHHLPRRQRQPVSGLDIAVVTFSVGIFVVPWAVLFLSGSPNTSDAWRTVLGPLQYLVVYLIFSRAGLTKSEVSTVLQLALAVSVFIAVVGFAQLLNVPGVRSFLEAYYPRTGSVSGICEFGVCRPTSLIEHWSAFGAYGMMFFTLALALAASGRSAFSGRWLGIVMAVNALAVLASQTQAAWIGVVVSAIVVIVHQRRAPRQLAVIGLAVIVGVALFFPQIQSRVLQQFGSSGSVSLQTPQSLQTRERDWGEIFIPALEQSPWVGTGTVLPSTIPTNFVNYADNEYLSMGFRAGAVGIGLLVTLLVTVFVAGWRTRRDGDPVVRAIGATACADVVALAIMGVSGEYLTFVGVSQTFWMTVALLPHPRPERLAAARAAPTIISVPRRQRRLPDENLPAAEAPPLRRILGRIPGVATLGPSAMLFAGNAVARVLGLAFSLACARFLVPAEFGLVAYALVIANFGAFLIGNAPTGLARFLPRVRHDPAARNAYFSNALVVVIAAVLPSVTLIVPAAALAGLAGPMTLALVANLVGTAAYVTYREAQRGHERFGAMVGFYVIANVVQLVAVVAAGLAGYRNAAVFVTAYGLSNLVALAIMHWVSPLRLRFVWEEVRWQRLKVISVFTWPLLLQTFFYLVWFGSDLVLVKLLLPPAAAGEYAAAKTLANVLLLAPFAIAGVLGPRVARIRPVHLQRYLGQTLAFASITIGLCALATIALRHPALRVLFGSKYADSGGPLVWLSIGMSIYGIYIVLETTCIGLARTIIDPIATGVGTIVTVVGGIILVPRLGLDGAALAFAGGAAAQVAVIAPYTLWAVRRVADDDIFALEHGRPLLEERIAPAEDEVWATS